VKTALTTGWFMNAAIESPNWSIKFPIAVSSPGPWPARRRRPMAAH
jgi:hypothetical protein